MLRSPVFVSTSLCCGFVAAFIWSIVHQTGGMFVYSLDDSYIHLAEAHTLAVYHLWGIGPFGFATASSSPIWTVLLATLERVAGLHIATPIVLNVFFTFGIFYAAEKGIERFVPRTPVWARYVLGVLIILVTPLPNIVLMGMEHVAQAFSILSLVLLAVEILMQDSDVETEAWKGGLFCFMAALAGALRYEAAFAVGPIFLLLLWRRRVGLAIGIAVSAAIGPAVFGLYSHHVSGYWTPYSVMAKSQAAGGMIGNLRTNGMGLFNWKIGLPVLLTLLPIWLLRLRSRGFWEPAQLLLLLTFLISVIHILLGPVLYWILRYDSYFVCLRLFAFFVVFADEVWQRGEERWTFAGLPGWEKGVAGVACAGLLLCVPVFGRRVQIGLFDPVRAAVDRYHEHIQMVRFIGTYYDHDLVMVNDIGALALFTHAHLLDILGLGSVEPLLPALHGRKFDADDVVAWGEEKDAPIALLSSGAPTIQKITPKKWTLVQTWLLPRNVAYYNFNLSLYALKPSAIPRLCASLADFRLVPEDKIIYDACPKSEARTRK